MEKAASTQQSSIGSSNWSYKGAPGHCFEGLDVDAVPLRDHVRDAVPLRDHVRDEKQQPIPYVPRPVNLRLYLVTLVGAGGIPTGLYVLRASRKDL